MVAKSCRRRAARSHVHGCTAARSRRAWSTCCSAPLLPLLGRLFMSCVRRKPQRTTPHVHLLEPAYLAAVAPNGARSYIQPIVIANCTHMQEDLLVECFGSDILDWEDDEAIKDDEPIKDDDDDWENDVTSEDDEDDDEEWANGVDTEDDEDGVDGEDDEEDYEDDDEDYETEPSSSDDEGSEEDETECRAASQAKPQAKRQAKRQASHKRNVAVVEHALCCISQMVPCAAALNLWRMTAREPFCDGNSESPRPPSLSLATISSGANLIACRRSWSRRSAARSASGAGPRRTCLSSTRTSARRTASRSAASSAWCAPAANLTLCHFGTLLYISERVGPSPLRCAAV